MNMKHTCSLKPYNEAFMNSANVHGGENCASIVGRWAFSKISPNCSLNLEERKKDLFISDSKTIRNQHFNIWIVNIIKIAQVITEFLPGMDALHTEYGFTLSKNDNTRYLTILVNPTNE